MTSTESVLLLYSDVIWRSSKCFVGVIPQFTGVDIMRLKFASILPDEQILPSNAVVGVNFEAIYDNPIQCRAVSGFERDVPREDRVQDLLLGPAFERQLSAEQLVNNHPEGPHVRKRVVLATHQQLRTHVAWRAQKGTQNFIVILMEECRKPEVEEDCLATVWIVHNIRRL